MTVRLHFTATECKEISSDQPCEDRISPNLRCVIRERTGPKSGVSPLKKTTRIKDWQHVHSFLTNPLFANPTRTPTRRFGRSRVTTKQTRIGSDPHRQTGSFPPHIFGYNPVVAASVILYVGFTQHGPLTAGLVLCTLQIYFVRT
jgi:hypothetical protein